MARTYSVYVIELADEAGRRVNPDKPCVYVGQTGHTPEHRFTQHMSGKTASKRVTKYDIPLRPRLYASWNPLFSREEALQAEARLSERLRRRGFTVFSDGLSDRRNDERSAA